MHRGCLLLVEVWGELGLLPVAAAAVRTADGRVAADAVSAAGAAICEAATGAIRCDTKHLVFR